MQTTNSRNVGIGAGDQRDGEAAGEDCLQFVTCQVDQEEFALDILSVQEIIRMTELARVPKAPPYVEGVINLRGRIVPVLDLRRRLGLPTVQRTGQTRIVVVYADDRTIGLIVDAVREVIHLARERIEPPPSVGSSTSAGFTRGVGRLGDRLLILMDLQRLLFSQHHPGRDGQRG